MPLLKAADPSITKLTQALRACERTGIKVADLGGAGADMSFEQAFSNLAHAYLREKAPSLLDYEIGFQLVDRDQDNTKAIGIIGFKVGNQLIYAPVFWLNGDLKGHELLYLKNQDMFVPLKENWLNYITNRKPEMLGESVDRNTSMIGVLRPDLDRITKSPSKFASAEPTLDEMIAEVMPAFAYFATTPHTKMSRYDDIRGFDTFVKELDLDSLEMLVKSSQRHPEIAQAINQFYSLDMVSDAIKKASQRRSVGISVLANTPTKIAKTQVQHGGSIFDNDPIKRGALKAVKYDRTTNDEAPAGLNEEDQEKLLRDGSLILDHREGDEIAIPYNVQVEERLGNPHESGIYQVLTGVGNFERCLVILNPIGPHGRKSFATVVRLDEGKRNWINVNPRCVWTLSQPVMGDAGSEDEDDLNKWWSKLPDAKSLPDDKRRHIIIGRNGNATVPMKHDTSYKAEEDSEIFEIDCSDDVDYQYSGNTLTDSMYGGKGGDSYDYGADAYESYRHGARLHLDSKDGTTMRSNMGDIFLPTGCKILHVEPAEGDNKDDDAPCGMGDSHHSKKSPIRPGSVLDRQFRVMGKVDSAEGFESTYAKKDKAPKSVLSAPIKDDNPKHTDEDGSWADPNQSVARAVKKSFDFGTLDTAKRHIRNKEARITIWSDTNDVEVNGRRMSIKSAVLHMVADHGFTEKMSYQLIHEAANPMGGKKTWYVQYPDWVKRAQSPYLTDSQPQSVPFPPPETGNDPFMGSRVPTMFKQEESQVIPSLSGQTDREIYNPNTELDRTPMDLANSASSAAASGQREIFDTAMIGQMLKAVRDDTMVDRYLGDITKGMDRLGRILFQFYWHGDKFKDRFGEQDLPELEDGLRNAFEQVGDVLLFLREKTVEPYPEEQGFDLGQSEGA